ncbi:hypothetical protein JB92DRAFT_3121247 [Gautieria morchelliformis]|nr:hypothetical protein JB92DRAFT_3121247 [Gautieria morchelliformis]
MPMFFPTLVYLISPSTNDTRISIAAILMNLAISGHNASQRALASSSEFAAPTDHSSSTSTLLAVRPIL